MNKHQPYDLKQMQSLPLEAKILMSTRRIEAWFEHWDGNVYVGFSGGKDSTVLADLCARFCKQYGWTLYLLFVNTGLEYPEIQKFVKTFAEWLRSTYGIEVQLDIVRPEMRFDEVIKNYGYPAISKAVAHSVDIARRNPEGRVAKNMFAADKTGRFAFHKWKFLINAPFCISDKCCNVMKKKPSEKYAKETGRMPILGTMAEESSLRYANWLKHGCNAFQGKKPSSQPLSFWTAQDVLHYLKKYNVPYCSVYGDIRIKQKVDNDNVFDGQMNMIDYLECYEPEDTLETTGCDRTGCIFCMFGCTAEKAPNRFQQLKETHPRQYEYCIRGGKYTDVHVFDRFGGEIKLKHCTGEQIEKWVDSNCNNRNFRIEASWKPTKEGLGLGKVLDYIGVKYD